MLVNRIIFAVSLVALAFLALSLSGTTIPLQASAPALLTYHGYVKVYKYDAATQTWSLVSYQHNTLNTGGKSLVAFGLNSSGPQNVVLIAVGNCTNAAPAAGDTTMCNAATTEEGGGNPSNTCGFTNATGTWVFQGEGSWNVTKTFTSSCASVTANATALYNSSLGAGLANKMFAETTFTTTTLNSNDQLNVTWGIYVS